MSISIAFDNPLAACLFVGFVGGVILSLVTNDKQRLKSLTFGGICGGLVYGILSELDPAGVVGCMMVTVVGAWSAGVLYHVIFRTSASQ